MCIYKLLKKIKEHLLIRVEAVKPLGYCSVS